MLGLANNVATKVASIKVLEQIYETHIHADESFDDDSLFAVTENILKHATQIVDKIVQGTQVHVENVEEKTPKAGFSTPLCILESIASEMQCKPPGEEAAQNTTLAILNKLSSYSWEAKGVLTLADFAMEFGQFWLLAQLQESDRLAKSIAILKRVPVLLKPSDLHKKRQALLELNILIKATLQLSSYDPKYVPWLAIAMDHIPVDVYWAIVSILTNNEDKEHDLAPFAQKIHYVLNKLKIQLIVCRKKIVEAETYWRLRKIFRTPTEIMEVFKALIFTKDNVQPLVDGSTKQLVFKIDVLRKKNVMLFISSLDISDDDISLLKPIYDLQNKMYTVQISAPVAGMIRFIKEEWSFKGKPTLVVMNPQGKVEHPNAFHMIRVWRVKAFPFTMATEEELSHEQGDNLVVPIFGLINPCIKEDTYTFFYGGKDNGWIQEFTKKATAFAKDPFFKEAKIHIELSCVGKGSKGKDDHGILGKLWSGIESLFFTKVHKPDGQVCQEIQKLLSYKNESGWAVLTKGNSVVVTGHGVSILKVVEDIDKWKDHMKERGFEFCFKSYHERVRAGTSPCGRLDIEHSSGKVPDTIKCADCHRNMETFISYKCCHIDGPTAHC
ncbi:unnamed protein product [Malus baccata var. baccata]